MLLSKLNSILMASWRSIEASLPYDSYLMLRSRGDFLANLKLLSTADPNPLTSPCLSSIKHLSIQQQYTLILELMLKAGIAIRAHETNQSISELIECCAAIVRKSQEEYSIEAIDLS
jgi:hypothetical protein